MTTLYADDLHKLSEHLKRYRNRQLTIDELKEKIWSAAQNVSSHTERGLREFLQAAEGKLDIVQFTTDSDKVFSASLDVVRGIEERIETEVGP